MRELDREHEGSDDGDHVGGEQHAAEEGIAAHAGSRAADLGDAGRE
jgi:hypothetical protein